MARDQVYFWEVECSIHDKLWLGGASQQESGILSKPQQTIYDTSTLLGVLAFTWRVVLFSNSIHVSPPLFTHLIYWSQTDPAQLSQPNITKIILASAALDTWPQAKLSPKNTSMNSEPPPITQPLLPPPSPPPPPFTYLLEEKFWTSKMFRGMTQQPKPYSN